MKDMGQLDLVPWCLLKLLEQQLPIILSVAHDAYIEDLDKSSLGFVVEVLWIALPPTSLTDRRSERPKKYWEPFCESSTMAPRQT